MRKIVYRLIGASLLAGAAISGFAEDSPSFTLGPFETGMTFTEARSAAPDLPWEDIIHKPTGQAHGAVAYDALSWTGHDWTVKIGNQYDWVDDEVSNIELTRDFDANSRKACLAIYADVVEKSEASFGPMGHHTEFSDPKSKLYGDPYDGFKVKDVTNASKARIYSYEYGVQNFSTFAEFLDRHARAMVLATYIKDFNNCELRIAMFIPHIWDEDQEQFIVPPELQARHPGRYPDRHQLQRR